MIVCETPRLRLRHVVDGDAPFILELLTDPAFLANIGDRGVHNLDEARHYIATGPVASYQRYGFGLWLAELKSGAVPVGMCGLLRRDTHPDVEVGFALLPGFRRQGYAVEVARATLQYGLEVLGLRRIVALTAPANRDSIRILEQLDLRFERMVRFIPDGGESRLFALEMPPDTG